MPKEVFLEIRNRDDELHKWVKEQPANFIVEPNEDVQTTYASIANFVATGPFRSSSIRGFLAKADGWIIAHASVSDGVVVTRERKTGPGSQEVKIPNICEEFGVQFMNQAELLRKFSVKLVRA